MESISVRRNMHMNDRIQPGAVGSVGDVLGAVRLHQSTPQMAMRWDNVFYPGNDKASGSNVQDGQQVSWESGFGSARVVDGAFQGGRNFRTTRGYVIEDIRPADMFVEPFVSSLGDYTWRNRIATTYQALRTGKQFLPVPGPYQLAPGEIARGGNMPTVQSSAGGSEPVGGDNAVVSSDMTQNPVVAGAYGYRDENANLEPVSRLPRSQNPQRSESAGMGSMRR